MFKHVEFFCSLKRVSDFSPYGWANVSQGHLNGVGFVKGTF